MDCLFCKIAANDIPGQRVYEDEHTLAFLDINPTNTGHTLIIPKKHTNHLLDADDETLARCISTAAKVARAVKEATNADGVNLLQNSLQAAGQVVFHLHFHVVPRFDSDGFRHWPGKPYESEEAAQKMANKISEHLNQTT